HNINSSCISFWSTTTQTLKAEGRLTRLWIHLIVVQNNLLSGVSRLVVPSHQLPIHQLKGGKKQRDAFQFFSRTSPSQTLFFTYYSLLAILNIPQFYMAFTYERPIIYT